MTSDTSRQQRTAPVGMADAGLPPPVLAESAGGGEDGSSSPVGQDDADIKFQPPVKMEAGEAEFILPDVSLIVTVGVILSIFAESHAHILCEQL